MSKRSGIVRLATGGGHGLPAWLPSAVSALVLGAQLGCDGTSKLAPGAEPSAQHPSPSLRQSTASAASAAASAAAAPDAAQERQRDCCMGKNACKGKGGCAVPESHACRGQNECKGKGGCNGHCPRE